MPGQHLGIMKFRLPFDNPTLKSATNVCVVGVVGKGRQSRSKAAMLNVVMQRDVFGNPIAEDNQFEQLIQLEGYFDEENKVVYLHLRSGQDTSSLSDMCQRAAEEISQIGYHNFLQSSEHQYAKALLYLFSISHIILLVNQGSAFDMTYVRLFRVLHTVRAKLLPSVTEALRGLGLPKDWILSGRPCSPRVLFIFERSTLTPSDLVEMSSGVKTRSQKTPPIKRLQHAIEDQIYHILRKSRIITNISNNSLFAVPANQEFVYICQGSEADNDLVSYYLGELCKNCSMPRESDVPRNRSYQTNRRGNHGSSRSHASEDQTGRTSLKQSMFPASPDGSSFQEFLWQHIELALSKGFDDNVGRNPVAAVFELPQIQTFLAVSNKLYNFFMLDQPESRAIPHFNTLKSLLEIDGRFSELRCTKILPIAERAYREGLPCHYTRTYHKNKVEQADQVFQQHARGPACEKYLAQLSESCDKYWLNGHQQCEEKSLTDQPCINPLHRIPEIPETDSNASLAVMPHSSQVKTKSSCNCGSKQSEREDPFDHRTANYDFYSKMDVACCGRLEKYILPVFQPSIVDVKAGGAVTIVETTEDVTSQESVDVLEHVEDNHDSEHEDIVTQSREETSRKNSSVKYDLASGMSGLSLALSLGQSGGSDLYSPGANTSYDPVGHELASESNVDTELVTSPLRQVSTTEYLPGMLHSDSPAGLLPKFPSWSLLSFGKHSVYNPSQGLDQPSFMHGSNFLLPWDVTVKVSDKEKWPAVGDTQAAKKGKISAKKFHKESGELSLRLYIGFEYECPRGHRFSMSAPDKIFKAPVSGNFKETASKVINNDMPLYFPCHCRSPKGFMGQLMRVFVSVPEGPIDVRLNPRVKPNPSPCPVFLPSSEGAFLLTTGFWVLRLPYVYLGETGVYLMPADPQHVTACRLFKGIICVQES